MVNELNQRNTYEIRTSDGILLDTSRSKSMGSRIVQEQKEIQRRSDIIITKVKGVKNV